MPIRTSVWIAGSSSLSAQDRIVLDSERRLEDWIVADPALLGDDLLFIARQIHTSGGYMDVLAIDAEGTLVVAELKKDKTPREVVAQVLDYASWIRDQTQADIDRLCMAQHGRGLADKFIEHFETALPDSACGAHRLLIVAAALDDSSERIVRYLQEAHGVDINVAFFSVYQIGAQQVVVRAWLADPEETQQRAERRVQAAWTGVFFVNTGINDDPGNVRKWEYCRDYGFVSAGGNEKYSRPLKKLHVGDTVAAYRKGLGYLGIGTINAEAVPVGEFKTSEGRSLTELTPLHGERANPHAEWAVGIKWLSRKDREDEAERFPGAFAVPLIVCKLRDEATLEMLQDKFGLAFGQTTA